MEKKYTYDPSRINDNGLNQMRFELGDTMINGGEETCVLCDEEYIAVISKTEKQMKSWKQAKIECLKAIVMKLSYEVDYSVADMSLKLSARYKNFKEMLDKLEKDIQIPSINSVFENKNSDNSNYFYLGMQENLKAK